MVEKYKGIPNKKALVYSDPDGHEYRLGKRSLSKDLAARYVASGTLWADGHLTVTGTQFKTDSIPIAVYNTTSALSGSDEPISAEMSDGTVTFYGKAEAKFFYIVIN